MQINCKPIIPILGLAALCLAVSGCAAAGGEGTDSSEAVDASSKAAVVSAADPDTVSAISGSFAIEFPCNATDKNEDNAAVYEIEPFTASFDLPNDWQTGDLPNQAYELLPVWSKVGIFNQDDELVGAIGYTVYEEYPGAENDPKAIYGQIALGNNYRFDVRESYTVANETNTSVTALVPVYYSASINNGTEKQNAGIVSYNPHRLVYVAMELDSALVTEEQARTIAESLDIA